MTTPKTTTPRSQGRGTPRRSNGVATRKRILLCASDMFATAGYEATSLRQIATAANIDIATLKYHFGDKPALYAEVYRIGHEALLEHLQPCLQQLHLAQQHDELLEALHDLVRRLHDFVEAHLGFMRMVVYRLLEGSEAIIDQEEALQGVATDMFDDTLQQLQDKGLIRTIDHRAFVSLLISAFTTWFVIAEVKPKWMHTPPIFRDGQASLSHKGRERSEAFFVDLVTRMLLDNTNPTNNT